MSNSKVIVGANAYDRKIYYCVLKIESGSKVVKGRMIDMLGLDNELTSNLGFFQLVHLGGPMGTFYSQLTLVYFNFMGEVKLTAPTSSPGWTNGNVFPTSSPYHILLCCVTLN